MFWRPIRKEDLVQCQAISPGGLGSEIVGLRRTLEIWRDLLDSAAFAGAAVEYSTPRYVRNTRELGEYLHRDFMGQANVLAVMLLLNAASQ